MTPPLTLWALSDGRAGMRNQALGLAEAVGRRVPSRVVEKRIAVRQPWDRLPRALWGDPFARLSASSDPLEPPWPDVLVACGRRTVPFALALGDRCFTVQTQDPRVSPGRFGLVVPPAHDGLEGANVVPILGSPNRLSEARLAGEGAALEAALPPLPRPLAAVLIGGPSKAYRMTPAAVDGIAARLEEAAAAGFGLLVTFSRRTPKDTEEELRSRLADLPAWVWDGAPIGGVENPYPGLLGLAEVVLVTEESANMLTEAAFTGRPVHLLRLEGGSPKWRRLHEDLEGRGALRPGAPLSQRWSYEPLRETDRAAEAVLAALRLSGKVRG
ncbi:mitochondrial fission ELM1 family protein [Parvularcula dongshanensis]|uniref:Nucleoside-diphosphate sugar epimerase n=1 Tax=Parvularcula dongshanensis TaxID=1173995 RepID=A0A840I2K6_9PROT|nr:mitochondrial fission ELM1 family protein [Parvularcula dongshanensis]MBB4659069.1 hypothetical protein [Parvularcula dongshanensis]